MKLNKHKTGDNILLYHKLLSPVTNCYREKFGVYILILKT